MASISTEEDVVNIALALVGITATLTDLDTDTTNHAAVSRTLYYNVRDNMLRDHPWNFATRRAQLTDSGSDPTFGWEEGFTLPSDFLRVIDVFATDSLTDRLPYRLEAQVLGTASTATQVLLCNSTTCFLIYIYKETDPSRWTEGFQDAVAWRLASYLSRALVGSNSDFEALDNTARQKLSHAKAVDGMEDWPQSLAVGSWIGDRGGQNVDRWGDED